MSVSSVLVVLEFVLLISNAILVDDGDVYVVTSVNVAFAGGSETVLDEGDGVGLRNVPAILASLVLSIDLVVHHGLNEFVTRSLAHDRHSLEGTDGIVTVHGTLSLGVQTGDDVERVVREEALVVQSVGQHLSNRWRGHLLTMLLLVEHHTR